MGCISKIPIIGPAISSVGSLVGGLLNPQPQSVTYNMNSGSARSLPAMPGADTTGGTTGGAGTSSTGTAAAPALGDSATQAAGNSTAASAAQAAGRAATILSDQTNSDVTDGDPNLIKQKTLLGD